jgi:hypothetical protein
MTEQKDELPPLTPEGKRWQLATKAAFGVFCLALAVSAGGMILERPEIVLMSGATGVPALLAIGLCSAKIRG